MTNDRRRVYSPIDLRADPIDQAVCNRILMVAAKFATCCCCCSSDVIPGCLIHGVTIYRKRWDGRLPAGCHRPAVALRGTSRS